MKKALLAAADATGRTADRLATATDATAHDVADAVAQGAASAVAGASDEPDAAVSSEPVQEELSAEPAKPVRKRTRRAPAHADEADADAEPSATEESPSA